MALGNRGNTGNLIILKPVTKDDVRPYFEIRRKKGGIWETEEDGVTSVTGVLTKIETETKTWEGTEYNVAKVFLQDEAENEVYLIDLRYTIASRSLFNALINLEDVDSEISISLYTNNNGYASFGVWQNDELVRWKYDLEEIPEPKKVKFKGKEMSDFTDTDEFFAGKLKEFNESSLGKSASKPASSQTKNEPQKTVEPDVDEDVDDDIPF